MAGIVKSGVKMENPSERIIIARGGIISLVSVKPEHLHYMVYISSADIWYEGVICLYRVLYRVIVYIEQMSLTIMLHFLW